MAAAGQPRESMIRTALAANASRRSVPARITTLAPGLALALCAGAIAATRSFDGLYGQDAYAYFDYATQSVRQSLQHAQPLDAFFWPPGYPLLVALASLPLGATPLAGQLVSLLMGALVPILTGLLARELFPEQKALAMLAGAIAAVSGQLWQSSVVVMADTTGLALATFSAFALARYAASNAATPLPPPSSITRGASRQASRGVASRARAAWLLAASAAIAYATLARWIYGIVAVPFAAYALTTLWQRRRIPIEALVAIGVAALILGPIVGPPLLNLISHPTEPAAFAGNFQVYSWSPLNALRHDFFTADGHLEYSLPNGLYYAIAPANLAFFGPLLALCVLPGLWAARAWPRPTALLLLGWAFSVYAFHAGAPWQNFRFTLAYLPPLAVVAAAGIVLTYQRLPQRTRLLILAYAALGLLVAAVAGVRLVERFIDTKDQELALVHWVQAQTPPDAELLTFGPTLAFRHYSALPTLDLYDLSTADLERAVHGSANLYVLVDEASLASQWRDQAPSNNFLHLRDAGLDGLGTYGGYSLYRARTT